MERMRKISESQKYRSWMPGKRTEKKKYHEGDGAIESHRDILFVFEGVQVVETIRLHRKEKKERKNDKDGK